MVEGGSHEKMEKAECVKSVEITPFWSKRVKEAAERKKSVKNAPFWAKLVGSGRTLINMSTPMHSDK
jgi:hypothetical protein